jgi:hypothetical protein
MFLLNFNAIRELFFIIYVFRAVNYHQYRPSVDLSFSDRRTECIVRIKWIFHGATETMDIGSSCLGGILSWDCRRRSVFRGRSQGLQYFEFHIRLFLISDCLLGIKGQFISYEVRYVAT